MVLIVSTFGATDRYPDGEMMRKTLNAFLGSLRRQNSDSFRLFLVGHDLPPVSLAETWISWTSISDGTADRTSIAIFRNWQRPRCSSTAAAWPTRSRTWA